MKLIDKELHDAAIDGDSKKVCELIRAGADVNSLHSNGYTPLMHVVREWSCESKQKLEVVRILLENGANAAYVAEDNYQAIIMASDIDIVNLLMNAGVKITSELATDLMYNFSGGVEIKNLLQKLEIHKTDWVDSERQIYNRIRDYCGNDLYQEVLLDALPFLGGVIYSLKQYKDYRMYINHQVDLANEYTLYALHRINEILLLSFQKKQRSDNLYTVSKITNDQYIEFWNRLGMDIVEPVEFHPFLSEIFRVEVVTVSKDAPEITAIRWPCLMFGELLFSRASVAIKVDMNAMKKETAEQSTLYWSHWRYDRPCADLSHGWGGNSQWQTRFRLDYWSDDNLYYNTSCNQQKLAADELDIEEQMELLKFRCFINGEEILDCFPYDYSATEKYKYRK